MTLANLPWMPGNIVQRALSDLKPYAGNARTHSAAQIDALAESISRFGFPVPILVDSAGTIIAGHGRYAAAQKLNLQHVPVIVADHLTDDQRRAYTLADNQLASMSEWNADQLTAELRALASTPVDLSGLGFDDVLASLTPKAVAAEQLDAVPADDDRPADSQPGQVYHLGPHRLMCGDSTNINHVNALVCGGLTENEGDLAHLIHADPPYGMGKEADGVENDNLYASKLDRFQMEWWHAWRHCLGNSGSVYIWGNAPDLWRLWYRHLESSDCLTLRNEITWDKEQAQGITSEGLRSYATATERCLFFVLGQQGFNNNSDNYWQGWEPLRAYLVGELAKIGWTRNDIDRITGTKNNYQHWFTDSQWCLITADHYAKLQAAANGAAFTRDHADLAREHATLREQFNATRAWFDNTHDSMTDVWRFPRVTGADRHGHATPKPVAMIVRAIKSSCPPGGLVLEPFGGTGTTLIAAAECGRVCRMMEITPKYCDTIRRRWTAYAQAAGIDAGGGALV